MRHSRELLFSPDTLKLELLLTPINRLDLKIEGSDLEVPIRTALADLKRVKINKLRPYFYISTGYGTVAGTTSVALGFYDCNDLLRELNRELRGFEYNFEDRVDLVRHELGHAFSYAYKLYRRDDFREMFNVQGNYFQTYPEGDDYIEHVNPWSRDYVNPSGDHYAQKHPDEDFAETFTVWLRPRHNWRRAYRGFPGALRKLEFVDALIKELRGQEPLVDQTPNAYEALADFSKTLASFFHLRNTRPYRLRATGFIDPDLKTLFLRPPAYRGKRRRELDYVRADSLLRRHKRSIVAQVSRWVGVDEFAVKDLLDKCCLRARALDMWVRKDERDKKLLEFTSYTSYHCALYALNDTYFGARPAAAEAAPEAS
jgi:hypothetical protein